MPKGLKHNTIKIHCNSTANKLRHRRDSSKGITSNRTPESQINNVVVQYAPRSLAKRFIRKDIVDNYTLAKQYRFQLGTLESEIVSQEVIDKLTYLESHAYKTARELEKIVKNIPD